MALTYREVAEILKIIDASDCEELVLDIEGTRLTVRRGGASAPAGGAGAAAAAPAPAQEAAGPGSPPAETGAAPAARPAEAQPRADDVVEVKAPMVGTFFRRPSPDEEPLVEEGATVKAGDPLCLIEVMKLYTTIEAPTDGTVRRIAAEDGALVEFDQLLFLIDPA